MYTAVHFSKRQNVHFGTFGSTRAQVRKCTPKQFLHNIHNIFTIFQFFLPAHVPLVVAIFWSLIIVILIGAGGTPFIFRFMHPQMTRT